MRRLTTLAVVVLLAVPVACGDDHSDTPPSGVIPPTGATSTTYNSGRDDLFYEGETEHYRCVTGSGGGIWCEPKDSPEDEG